MRALAPGCACASMHAAAEPWLLRRLEYEPDSGSEAGGITDFRSPHPIRGTILEGSQELDESWAL